MKNLILPALLFFFCLKAFPQGIPADTSNYLAAGNWDNNALWTLSKNTGVTATKAVFNGLKNNGISLAYTFPVQNDWADISINLPDTFSTKKPIAFFIRSSVAANNLEMKFLDKDGSIFLRVVPLSGYSGQWKHIVIYPGDTKYGWGGNNTLNVISRFSLAINGLGSGSIWIDEIGIGKEGLPSSFPSVYDPDSAKAGIGFTQRRDLAMTEEDSLATKYLKVLQDVSSPAKNLMPSQEDDQAQTFNNSLVAIAFILKNERERAERILDFYENATDVSNTDITKQNFYYNGEARGFYQWVSLATKKAPAGQVDRWMGDMAWLLIACKNYELQYSSDRYSKLVKIIKDLLISFYKEAPVGGYIQSGWRKGDSFLHETTGHPEGNIDCYVALKLCNENYYAQKIKIWLINELKGRIDLPLDLYTWRVLAFGSSSAALLNIPEYDFSYRKILTVGTDQVMGFYSGSAITINNFWNDGTGHMACAYLAFGEKERGYFYANQLDHLLVERNIGGVVSHAIPYTLNKTGGNDWVDPSKGFVSSTAWYIFAKNRYNPFCSAGFTDTEFSEAAAINEGGATNVFPNPFSEKTTINYSLASHTTVQIEIYNLLGVKIKTLVNGRQAAGNFSACWEGNDYKGNKVPTGVYFARITKDKLLETQRMLYIKY